MALSIPAASYVHRRSQEALQLRLSERLQRHLAEKLLLGVCWADSLP